MMFELPSEMLVGGKPYKIRTDYRCILEICVVLSDPDLQDHEKCLAAISIFYIDAEIIPSSLYADAMESCLWFINCGENDHQKQSHKLLDWEQDFKHIVGPVSRVYGKDIRSIPYDRTTGEGGMHWWTFMAFYSEIGDCLFAQIVRIRDARAKGKKLEKSDKEWLRQNRHLVDFKNKYSSAEEELLKQWT